MLQWNSVYGVMFNILPPAFPRKGPQQGEF